MPEQTKGLRASVASGVAWTAAEVWLVRLLALGTFVILARLLTPRDFGVVALAAAFIGVLNTVAEGGMTAFVIQARNLNDDVLNSVFWTSAAIAGAAAALLAGLAPLIAHLLHVPRLTWLLVALAPSLLCTGLNTVPTGLLQRDMLFARLAGRQLTGVGLGAVVGISLALAGAGAWALVAQSLANALGAMAMLWRRSTWRPRFTFSRIHSRAALQFGWKALGISLVVSLRDQGQALVIGASLGPEDLGYWTIATRIMQILLELGISVVQVVITPAFVKLRSDREKLTAAYGEATSAAAMIVLPLLVVVAVLGSHLTPALFGQDWQRAGNLTTILTLSGGFSLLVNFDQSMYIALGKPGIELSLVCGIVATQLLVVVVFARFGLTAVAIAFLARAAVTWPIRAFVLRRVAGTRWSAYTGLIPVAVACAVGGLVAREMMVLGEPRNTLWLVASAIVGLVAYGAVVYCLSRQCRSYVQAVAHTVKPSWPSRTSSVQLNLQVEPEPCTSDPDVVIGLRPQADQSAKSRQ